VRLQGLQREIDCEAAGQAAGTIARWEATLREVLWAARSHLGEHWEPFVAGIRANQQLAAIRGSPAKRDWARQVPRPRTEHHVRLPVPPEAFTPASSDLEELLRGSDEQAERRTSRDNYFCCSNLISRILVRP
jgi:hypothetical protein